MAKLKAPPKGEFAGSDTLRTVHNWTGNLLGLDDPLLAQHGGDVRVYRELLRDDQVAATLEQRFKAVISREWDVEPASESRRDKQAAIALREQIAELEWDRINEQMLYANHYGYSVGEVMWGRDGNFVTFEDILVRPHERFRRGFDGHLYLLTQKHPQGLRMPERKFWWATTGAEHSEQPYGRGLAYQLYWPVFFKRNGMKFWAIFLEKFSQPTVSAAMPRAMLDDPEQRKKALEFLDAIMVDSAVLRPEDIPIEMLEATRSGTADYDSLKDAMNEAIAKMVLGQTMTTEDGSSLAQAKVHMSVRDDLIKADADLISASFNRGPVRWWTEWNFPTANPPRLWRRIEQEEDAKDRVARDEGIYKLGYRPTPDYIEQTYGPGWEPAKEPVAPPMAPGVPPQNPDDEGFAEGDTARMLHRADQQALVDAAHHFAGQYEDILGERVAELLTFLEYTEDVDTFKAKLRELIEEPPPAQAVETIQKAGVFARLMGALRHQKA